MTEERGPHVRLLWWWQDDTTGDSGLGGLADDIAETFDGHDSWVDDGGGDAAVMEKATVVGYGSRPMTSGAASAGQIGGEHDSANAAQQAGQEHSIEHAPTWTVVER